MKYKDYKRKNWNIHFALFVRLNSLISDYKNFHFLRDEYEDMIKITCNDIKGCLEGLNQ
jgi:hypothetical protein